jgi:hypothetical protein
VWSDTAVVCDRVESREQVQRDSFALAMSPVTRSVLLPADSYVRRGVVSMVNACMGINNMGLDEYNSLGKQ